jgi:hypothetical protein
MFLRRLMISLAFLACVSCVLPAMAQSGPPGGGGGPPGGGGGPPSGGGGPPSSDLVVMGWKITRTKSPVITSIRQFPNGTNQTVYPSVGGGGYTMLEVTAPESGSLTLTGPIEYEFEWVGGGYPPPLINIKETLYATASYSLNFPGDASASVNLGISDIPVYHTYGFNYDISGLNLLGRWETYSGSGSKIITKKNPPPKFTLSKSPNGSVTLTPARELRTSGFYQFWVNGKVTGTIAGGYGALPDPRNVKLTRPGAVNEWVDEFGYTHGHTRKSYKTTSPTGYVALNPIHQEFVPVLSGNWVLSLSLLAPVNYSWSPVGPNATYMFNNPEMPYGAQGFVNFFWTGAGLGPVDYQVTYKITDALDGAEGEDIYYLKAHERFEEKIKSDMLVVDSVNPVTDFVATSFVGETLSLSYEHSGTWTLGASFEGIPAHWIAKGMGISLDVSYSGTCNAVHGVSWVEPLGIGWGSYLESFASYRQIEGIATEWSANGAFADQPFTLRIPQGVGYRVRRPSTKYFN